MYQVAVSKCSSCEIGDRNKHLEAMAICNYATFICKQRKKLQIAYDMFQDGLKRLKLTFKYLTLINVKYYMNIGFLNIRDLLRILDTYYVIIQNFEDNYRKILL